jgi:anaerobic ribonucleoside-triphosphate reductase
MAVSRCLYKKKESLRLERRTFSVYGFKNILPDYIEILTEVVLQLVKLIKKLMQLCNHLKNRYLYVFLNMSKDYL